MTQMDPVARINDAVVSPHATLAEAIAKLDRAGTGALLLCEEDHLLAGLLTDGDIRRAILKGISLETPCGKVANRKPFVGTPSMTMAEVLHLVNSYDINHLPIVDSEGRVVRFLLRKDLISEDDPRLSAVIMAGGYGTRLLPLTEHTPKPMLPVGDRPLLELTIERLRASGIRRVSITTHYLPDKIVDHFGDGQQFGVDMNYVTEDHPLGTAGGLKMIRDVDGTMLVINGDILTRVPFQTALAYHQKHHADVTVGVRRHEVQVPYGVVECDGVAISKLTEKPQMSFLVNAGMYLVEPTVFQFIPDGQRFDMTDLIQRLLENGRRVVSFPIMEYWLDVGRHADYQQAQEDAKNGKL
jgi:dTDP-glucose pyrophosphorylase/CBS domain-containing protein